MTIVPTSSNNGNRQAEINDLCETQGVHGSYTYSVLPLSIHAEIFLQTLEIELDLGLL